MREAGRSTSPTVDRVIRPTIEARGLRWKGLYGGRRGFGTALVELTEAWSPHKRGLGHTNMATTVKHYKKLTQNGLADGMRLLEAAATSDQK
jgi:hypothetical protein